MESEFTPFHRGGAGTPLVLIHGFTDTWRSWDLVRPGLERDHDVLALTLPGHAGGPDLPQGAGERSMADAVERAMDRAGFETAHIAGNSLGGFVSLQMAERGRAESVVAFAPAGGWLGDGRFLGDLSDQFRTLQEMLLAAAPYVDAIVATPEGRRQATLLITENFEHIPPELIAHQVRGAAACDPAGRLIDLGQQMDWSFDPSKIECPVRIVWGSGDRILPWPSAAERFRTESLPHADWVVLDGVGHCPQLDVPLETVELIHGFTAR
jgi:pimeloyl-ACP methyl ester carboxylesterase